MGLGRRLKTIFTSGDTYTVLELIKKLIEEVEKYDKEHSPVGLYRHEITYQTNDGLKQLTVVSTSSEPLRNTSDMEDLYGTSSETVFSVVTDNVIGL